MKGLLWRGLLNSVTLTKIKLPWITSNYQTMHWIKAKRKVSAPPPPTPPFNFGYHFNINMSQKIVCYYRRRVWDTVESTNIKIFYPCDQRCCSQLLSPRFVLLLIQRKQLTKTSVKDFSLSHILWANGWHFNSLLSPQNQSPPMSSVPIPRFWSK